MSDKLTYDFLVELIAQCFTSRTFAEIVTSNLKYEYLPTEATKLVFKEIVDTLELDDRITTIGTISQKHSNHDEVKQFLKEIKQVKLTNSKDQLLDTLEDYVKESMFVELYDDIAEEYNKGDKTEAIIELSQRATSIAEFSVKQSSVGRVFKDFDKRNLKRQSKTERNETKIPTGIHPFDFYTYGGINAGTSLLALGRSGGGKSTFLKWLGIHAARLGYNVVHFQAEGTEDEAFDNYDAGWTGISTIDIEEGYIPPDKLKKIKIAHHDLLAQKGEIFIKSSEQFDEMYLDDCRDYLIELERSVGKINLILFDYLELFMLKGKKFSQSESGERRRRELIANRITNIATEMKCATATVTQATDIKTEKYNDPDYVMTRSDIAEFKGAVKPFSYFITLNQTDDEYDNGSMRIFIDKMRKYKGRRLFTIAQSMDNARFYNSNKTLDYFWDENRHKPK
tara:strand:- start:505 stop:1863 length:1359 start_codon:yes stop_codon:yes gene_type:complete